MHDSNFAEPAPSSRQAIHSERDYGLIGRHPELQLIHRLLERRAGDPTALLLTGEPGVGKTALLEAASRIAARSGFRLLRAAGFEAETDLTYAALNQLLLPLLDDLSGLEREERVALQVALGFGEGPTPDRSTVTRAATSLLARSAPVLLLIDDAPWLDRASAAVVRGINCTRVTMLAAARSDDVGVLVGREPSVHHVRPLTASEAARLVSSRFPQLEPEIARRVVVEAHGNPLALLELPAALGASHRLTPASPSLPLPGRLSALFARRIGMLTQPARELLLLVALDAGGCLRTCPGAGSFKPFESLGAVEQAGLVSMAAGGRLVLRHSLVRQAVLEHATEADRRRAHRQLAGLATAQPDDRAWHVGQAAIEPDETTALLLERSARRSLRQGDAVRAVATLVRASELSPASAGRGRRLAEAAYVAARAAGAIDDAPKLLADALRADPRLTRSLEAARTAAQVVINGEGDVATAHRLLAGAITARGSDGDVDPRALAKAAHELLRICVCGGRAELWRTARAAIATACQPLPPDLDIVCQLMAGPVRADDPMLVRQLDHHARENLDPDPITAVMCVLSDRLPSCRPALEALLRDARAGGAVGLRGVLCSALAYDAFLSGDWTLAGRLAEESRSISPAVRHWAFGGHYVRLLLAAARDRRKHLHGVANELVQWAAPRGFTGLIWCLAHARALAALGQGEFEDAFQHLSVIDPADAPDGVTPYARWITLDLAEAAVRSGRPHIATAHAAAVRAAGFTALSTRVALTVRGAEAIAADHESDFVTLFERALAAPGASGWPFEYARIELAYGERLRRHRASVQARRHLRAAFDVFERLGAIPWAERAASELRASSESKPRIPKDELEALTARELEIATLATAGLSNKQIGQRLSVSPRTVGAHLRHVFRKLGISSRAALRSALHEARR